jgi:peptide/nickel transport system permease protein
MKSNFLYRFSKNKLALACACIFLVICFLSIFSSLIFNYKTDVIGQNLKIRLQAPSWRYPLGTDDYGRNVLARIVYGSRYSLLIGISSVAASLTAGLVIGTIAGYFGGVVDSIFMRLMDVLLGLPVILLAIAVVASLGPGLQNMILALSIAQTPTFARLVRVLVLSLKDQEFIEASKAVATPDYRIIIEQILPNILGPIIVQATLSIAWMILVAASLSYLGLGVQPPTPEWGAMLSDGKRFINSFPGLIIYPGLAIVITVLSLNLIGDGIRDATDPRLRD